MIEVAFVADLRYVENLAVALYSLSLHATSSVNVHIFLDSEAGNLREELSICSVSSLVTVNFYDIEISRMRDLSGSLPPHVSKTAFYRIFIPQLLPHLKRLIYLDCDVLIRSSLDDLWEEDISSVGIGAVRDGSVCFVSSANGISQYKALSIDARAPYFNSGVMLIDLDWWRSHDGTDRAVNFIVNDQGKTSYIDQAAVNVVSAGRWKQLDVSWNVQSASYYGFRWPEYIVSSVEFYRAVRDPKIVHFAGPSYPGQITSRNPFSSQWRESLSKTPFKKKSLVPTICEIFLARICCRIVSLRRLEVVIAD